MADLQQEGQAPAQEDVLAQAPAQEEVKPLPLKDRVPALEERIAALEARMERFERKHGSANEPIGG